MCSEKFLVIFLLLQVNCCHGTQTGKKKSLWVDVTFHNLALEHPGVYRFAADVNASVDNVDTPSALILKCRLKVNIETETSAFKHEEVISKKYDAGARDKINHKFTFTMANEYQEFMRDIKCSAQLHTTDITGHPSLEAIDLDDKQHVGLEETDSSATPEVPVAKKSPAWDALRVTFGLRPEYLLRTVEEAKKDGWSLDKSCDYNANGFYGHRYVQKGDLGAMLLFDDAGYIAGIQTAAAKGQSNGYPSGNVKKSFVEESDKFTVSAYFTDPAKICNGGRSKAEFEAQGTGDRLVIQDGSSLMTIPMEEIAVKAPWVRGKCFIGMGVHYWYDISADMKCSDTKPLFLLYNKGKLNAFGWALFADLPSSRFEHPPSITFGGFMKTVPTCLKTEGTISTMHIYMTSIPYRNLC